MRQTLSKLFDTLALILTNTLAVSRCSLHKQRLGSLTMGLLWRLHTYLFLGMWPVWNVLPGSDRSTLPFSTFETNFSSDHIIFYFSRNCSWQWTASASSSFFFQFYWAMTDIQHRLKFEVSKHNDLTYMHHEMIITVCLVKIHHLM